MKTLLACLGLAFPLGLALMAGTTPCHAKTEMVETCTLSLSDAQAYMLTNHSVNIAKIAAVPGTSYYYAYESSGHRWRITVNSDCEIINAEDFP